jgi:hypothetical protein
MKTTAAVFSLLLASGLVAHAGGARVGVVVNPGRAWCPPAPISRPVVFRTYPTTFGCAPTAFYSWGPNVIVSSTGPGSGFSTVSPIMNYAGQTPIYRVPPPVLPAQPVTVYPSSAFRWRN